MTMIAPISPLPAAAVSTGNNASAYAAFAGRILLATIFVLSGFSKVADPASALGYIGSVGLPFPQLGLGIAILVEIVGGITLILGYRTRLVALTLALFSLATAIFFHSALGDQNQFIHFFKNVAMAGGLLQVAAFGSGSIAIGGRR
jgi:putative oxidoreductase